MKILTDAIVVEPFDDRVEILADELEHTIAYGVSSILLAVYQSEFVRADVEAVLVKRLRPLGQRIERVFINEDNYDLPLDLRQRADKTATVYSISGLRFGGGEDDRDAYRALNIRREYFVDDHMRVIFWLTEDEAFDLPRYAPDFWAFRHRTVEFMDEPQTRHISKHTDKLTWQGWGDNTFSEDTAAKIAYREQLLSDLPYKPERVAARANLLYTLGPLYTAQGDYEKAIGVLKEAIALNPKLANPYNGLGNVYQQSGRYEDAITAYNKAIMLDPSLANPYNGLGNIYYQTDRFEDAITAYNKAITLDPKLPHPHNGLGNVYSKNGRYEDAIISYEEAIALAPLTPYQYNNLGDMYQQNHRYKDAITAYKETIILDPKLPHPHNGLGLVYENLGRNEEAIASYKEAITLNPKIAYQHRNLGDIYHQNGRFEDAISAYKQAIELDPKYAYPHNGLGNVYRQNGRFPEAISAYKKTVEIDPKFAIAQMGLAAIYRIQGQTAVYNKQIEITRPLIANSDIYNRACFASIAGEVEEAVELLKEAITIAPAMREWAQKDPDFEFIRDDPRFQAAVGGA